jgi:hypothetical protein
VKKFLFIYNASKGTDSDADWMTWFTSIGQSVVDMGNPFDGGKIVTSAGGKDITEWADFIGGYSLVNAADMDAAVALAKGCPNKTGVRVFEAIPM